MMYLRDQKGHVCLLGHAHIWADASLHTLLCAMCVMTTADATTCMLSTRSGGSWVESPTLWFMKCCFWNSVELRISVLSGRGRSGVVAGSRSVGEEQLQQTWQRLDGGEEKGEVNEGKTRLDQCGGSQEEAGSRFFLFRSCFTQRVAFFPLSSRQCSYC